MSTAEGPCGPGPAFNRGRLLVLLAGILWSLAGVFIKSLNLPALTITFYRSLFAGLFFSVFVRGRRWQFSLPVVVSTVSYSAAISSFVWANKLTTAANAIVLQYTAPIFVFVFVRLLFREPVAKADLVTLASGMVGIAIIFGGSAGQPDAPGVAVAVLSGFLFSIYVTNLRFLRGIDPAVLTLVNNLVCSVSLLPFVHAQLALTLEQVLALAVMGVVQLGIPYFLFSQGIERIPVQEASLIVLVEPVLNPVWVAWVVGEVPANPTLLGGGLILLSLAGRYSSLLSGRWARTDRAGGGRSGPRRPG